jgi:hypothetical protein
MLLAPAVLMCSALHAADDYELHYFTQDYSVCPPCRPVGKLVEALVNQGRAITIHKYEDDQQPFEFFGVKSTPSFVLLKNGAMHRYYEQSPGYTFTGHFLSGIAPPAETESVELEPVRGERGDCANPIGKILRNVLPPPPAPGVRDVPDVQKVERIQKLESDLASLQSQFNALHRQHHEIIDALKRAESVIASMKKPTHTTQQITQVDDRPIIVRMQGIRELDSGEKVVTVQKDKSYPRGTPLVLQFHESFLVQEEP